MKLDNFKRSSLKCEQQRPSGQSAEEQNNCFTVFSVAAVAIEMDKCNSKIPEDIILDFVGMSVSYDIFLGKLVI